MTGVVGIGGVVEDPIGLVMAEIMRALFLLLLLPLPLPPPPLGVRGVVVVVVVVERGLGIACVGEERGLPTSVRKGGRRGRLKISLLNSASKST